MASMRGYLTRSKWGRVVTGLASPEGERGGVDGHKLLSSGVGMGATVLFPHGVDDMFLGLEFDDAVGKADHA